MIALLTAILELLPFARRRTRGVSGSVVSIYGSGCVRVGWSVVCVLPE